MYCNIVWPFIGFVLSFLLTSSISLAAIAAMIILSAISAVDIFLKVVRIVRHRKSIHINKKFLNAVIATALVVVVLTILIVSQIPFVANSYANYRLEEAARHVPREKLIAAVDTLKKNQNSLEYCSLIFYPTIQEENQNVIAKYLAYYAYENKYCRQSWQFGKENCSYLEGVSHSTGHYTPIKDLTLCRYAHSYRYNQLVRVV